MTDTKLPRIYTAIPAIMGKIGHIGKDSKNKDQGWSFRGIDAVYNALNPILSEEGVFATCTGITNEVATERQSKSGGAIFDYKAVFTWRLYASDGSYTETTSIGKAMDTSDKDTNKAMSVAYKYALLQIFCIPTEEEKDPDFVTHEVKPVSSQIIEENDPDFAPHPSVASPQQTSPKSHIMATTKQVGYIGSLMKAQGIEPEVVYKKYGISSRNELTGVQASELIEQLLKKTFQP